MKWKKKLLTSVTQIKRLAKRLRVDGVLKLPEEEMVSHEKATMKEYKDAKKSAESWRDAHTTVVEAGQTMMAELFRWCGDQQAAK